ncbi:hypothetical protein XF24_00946 [candidate division SR1 bacterium Aalborg_AAW-1]|nr:hypothetical protein XF24_00946 [candidate division SR1 bacterium Aalborg_AAW-1]
MKIKNFYPVSKKLLVDIIQFIATAELAHSTQSVGWKICLFSRDEQFHTLWNQVKKSSDSDLLRQIVQFIAWKFQEYEQKIYSFEEIGNATLEFCSRDGFEQLCFEVTGQNPEELINTCILYDDEK